MTRDERLTELLYSCESRDEMCVRVIDMEDERDRLTEENELLRRVAKALYRGARDRPFQCQLRWDCDNRKCRNMFGKECIVLVAMLEAERLGAS